MYKAINKGFTLIELLVVIAIIGILAAIVLVSLGNARQSGADAGIKGNLDSIRTQAEVYAGANSNAYASASVATSSLAATCYTAPVSTSMLADPTIKQAITAAQSASGGTVTCAVSANPSFWAIAVQEKVDTTKAWCVSSNGVAKEITNTGALTAGNTCL